MARDFGQLLVDEQWRRSVRSLQSVPIDPDQKFIDFNLESWQVQHIGTYDWGNEEFSYEATLFNGTSRGYLDFSDDETEDIILYHDIKTSSLPSHIFTLLENGEKPREITYEGQLYKLEETSTGYYSETNGDSDDWEEIMNFTYLAPNGTYLSIDQWDEDEFECSKGTILSPAMIDQILPA